MAHVFIKKGRLWTQRQICTEERQCKERREKAVICKPRHVCGDKKLGEKHTIDLFLETSEEEQPYQYLDSELLAPRTVRQ